MILKMIAVAIFTFVVASSLAYAQQKVGSNAYIDMYFGDWHAAKSHTTHGSLVEHDLLARGDALHPTTKGAVLRYVNSLSYATLAPGITTNAIKLDKTQEIYYFLSGAGMISSGNNSFPLSENKAVLVPANLEFSIKNNGSVPLTMYLISEPVPNGFRPNTNLLLRDENSTPIRSADEDWTRIVKPLFVAKDGLATLTAVSTVALDPLTITKPYIGKHEDVEEVWTSISGTSIAMMGPFLRRQTPGIAYEHPPDNLAPTANINYSENDQVKLLYFVRDHDGASGK